MRKISKILAVILVISIILPAVVSASNMDEISLEADKTQTQETQETQVEQDQQDEQLHTGNNPEKEQVKEETKLQTEELEVKNTMQDSLNLNTDIQRINGENRVQTSIKVSQEAYKDQVATVLLAGYNGQADALTATFVAGQEDAPLLLTYKDKLDQELLGELARLSPEKIVILGGENVVYPIVEDRLKAIGYNVKRIKGSSRIETAINVASDYYDHKSGLSSATEVFMIEYDSLVDALAIGPVAARDGIPILIMKKDSVPTQVAEFLRKQDIKKATIIGGESRISEDGKNSLQSIVGQVERISGNNRVETSITICEDYFTNRNSTVVANGHQYTDALIGGYFAAKKNAPIILTNMTTITKEALHCIKEVKVKPYILGGENVISTAMFSSIKDAVTPKPDPVKDPMVCLDYGHGGRDPGALQRDEEDNIIRREVDDTIKLGKLVAKDLRRHGVKVDETRTEDEDLSLDDRVNFSNKKDYNYFVSFHRNSAASEKAHGVEVYTNQYSSQKSKDLAKSIQKNLVDVGFHDRGTKYANFTVISKTKAPAVLMEVGFIKNEGDNEIYDTKQRQIVKAISSAILGKLGIKYKN